MRHEESSSWGEACTYLVTHQLCDHLFQLDSPKGSSVDGRLATTRLMLFVGDSWPACFDGSLRGPSNVDDRQHPDRAHQG